MAGRVLSNQKGGKLVMLFTSNAELSVASANVDASETVTGLHINQIWTGIDSGFWKVSRGANTVIIHNGSDYTDYAGNGAALQVDPAANVVVECTSANCTLIVDFQKVSSYTSVY
jgi:hypothetical protein